MPPQQQIQGLPLGAELKPIEGLPEGAEVRPMGGQDTPPPPATQPFGGVSKNLEHQEYQPIHSMRDVGENLVKGVSNFGAGVLQAPYAIGHALLDPIQTGKELLSQYQDPVNIDPTGTLRMGKQVQSGQGAELAGNFVGGSLLGETGGATGRLLGKMRPTPSPNIVPPAEIAAERLGQAINPPGGIKPELLRNIQSEAPAIREYGQRTGNPLSTQAEGLKAAQGVSQEGLQHYQKNILPQVANNRVMLPNQVSPELGHSATLGQVDARITQINAELSNMEKAASSGAAIDTLRQSGFMRELNALKPLLYQGIEEGTGIPADQVKNFRQGYGGEFGLANQIEAAKNARLTRTASASQGKTTLGVPHSILEMPDRLINWARGGEQAIADRQFAKRIQAFDPQSPLRPTPNPPRQTPFMGAPVNPEVEGRIGAIGSDAGVQPTAPKPKPTLTGPMAKAPAVAEAEGASKTLQDTQNAAYRAKQAPALRPKKPEGLGPTQPPQAQIIPPPENYTRTVLEGAKRRSVPEPVPKPNVLDRLLGPAREGQEQARLLRKGKQQ